MEHVRGMPMRAAVWTAAAVAFAAAVPAPSTVAPDGVDDRTGQEPGREIFVGKGNCFACHGPEGGGTPVGPDLTDAEWINFEARPTAEAVRVLVREGVPKPVRHPAPMPPMGGGSLDDDEIAAVAAYVLTLSPGGG